MTFSIIARNPKTGEIGGAAATGNLCVGGWVLRGDIKKGITTHRFLSKHSLGRKHFNKSK